jgi:hypothetical protein
MTDRKTRMKSFRLDPTLTIQLSKTAKKLGVTESDYVSKVLRKSLTLQPLFQNFDGIGMSKALFQRIISQSDMASLEIIASEIAVGNGPFAFELLGLEINHTSMIWFLREVLQNLSWFSIEELEFENYSELKLFHHYDGRWSRFLRSCLLSLFGLIGEIPEISISERVVKVVTRKTTLSKGNNDFELLSFN